MIWRYFIYKKITCNQSRRMTEKTDSNEIENSEFDSFTDENITHEIIEELKALGVPKPKNVSWGNWVGPKDHSHRHDKLCAYAALGLTNNKIAEEMGMSVSRVCLILQQPETKKKIKELQSNDYVAETRRKIELLLGDSLELLEEQIKNKQESSKVRQAAAMYVIDQGIGKSKQEIEHKGSVLHQFMNQLEQLSAGARDVTPQALLAESDNPLDAFILENVPDSVKVGKRG